MLTYQLQTRRFKTENGDALEFPNRATVEVKFSPGSAFGTKDGPSRTAVRARAATVIMNANTGRWTCQSRPPLDRLDVTINSPISSFSLDGDMLRYEFQCPNIGTLEGLVAGLKWILPTLLNLEFSEPPVIDFVRGSVGETKFQWEISPEEWRINFRTVSPNKLEEHVVWSWEQLSLFNGVANRRLAAALSYFHVAVRLSVKGDSPWEFMAESILNYAKCLDILFKTSSKSMEDARRELKKLAYDEAAIEGDFVPILLLRSKIDVAHPRVAIFKSRDLRVLYRYMAECEDRFRNLLTRVLSAIRDGRYDLAQKPDLTLNAGEQRDVDALVTRMGSRLGVLTTSSPPT